MSRKKNTKKPRTFSIGIGIEAGSEIEFRWSQEAQILAYRVRKEGKPVKPVNTIISFGYDRQNKTPKILTSSSSPLMPPFINFNEALSKFAFVVAVDTSYPKDEDRKEG